MDDARIGKITFDYDVVYNDSDFIQRILSRTLIVNAMGSGAENNTITYTLYSQAFDMLKDTEETPFYTVVINGEDYHFERV